MAMIRSKSITQSAKGENCTVNSPACNGDRSTVVWAHSNMQLHGHGKGIKSHDILGCYSCMLCHHWLDAGDAPRAEKVIYFYNAMSRSLVRLIEKGIVVLK